MSPSNLSKIFYFRKHEIGKDFLWNGYTYWGVVWGEVGGSVYICVYMYIHIWDSMRFHRFQSLSVNLVRPPLRISFDFDTFVGVAPCRMHQN